MHNLRLTHLEVEIDEIPRAGQQLMELAQPLTDYVFLQTCNRAELYFNGVGLTPPAGFLLESGEKAFEHLLRVACGLESFVVGETEILSQLRSAYTRAREEGHCSDELGRYFEQAIKVGRKVRRETKISWGKVSVVSLALAHVEELLEGLRGKRVLVIGAGEVGSKVARALKGLSVEKILVANRRYERALKLAGEIGGSAFKLSSLDLLLPSVDLVICATSAPHYILTKQRVKGIKRRLTMVDLSVPRNIEDSVGELENIKLITLKDLEGRAKENLRMRMKEIKKVEQIIEQEVKRGRDGLRDLYKRAEAVRREEVEKALKLLASRPPERVIEDLSRVLVKKICHPLREHYERLKRGI